MRERRGHVVTVAHVRQRAAMTVAPLLAQRQDVGTGAVDRALLVIDCQRLVGPDTPTAIVNKV
jgi:hypothetical protein